jgi:hypothetical protein
VTPNDIFYSSSRIKQSRQRKEKLKKVFPFIRVTINYILGQVSRISTPPLFFFVAKRIRPNSQKMRVMRISTQLLLIAIPLIIVQIVCGDVLDKSLLNLHLGGAEVASRRLEDTPAPTAPPTSVPSQTPVTEAPTPKPETEAPTSSPVTEAPTSSPVTEPPTSSPVTEPPTSSPVTESPTPKPVTESPTSTPVMVQQVSPTEETSAPTKKPVIVQQTPPVEETSAPVIQFPPTSVVVEGTEPPTSAPMLPETPAPTSPSPAPTSSPATNLPTPFPVDVTLPPFLDKYKKKSKSSGPTRSSRPTRSPRPTSSPTTESPTVSPTNYPTYSPTSSPTSYPTPSPNAEPIERCGIECSRNSDCSGATGAFIKYTPWSQPVTFLCVNDSVLDFYFYFSCIVRQIIAPNAMDEFV